MDGWLDVDAQTGHNTITATRLKSSRWQNHIYLDARGG